jgi:hypothetical protein
MSGPENGKAVPQRSTARKSIPALGSHEPRKLPPGKYPGFEKLPAQPGVYRTKLWHQTEKRDPGYADYKGILQLTGSKALILVWVHADGSLGLRLEKITEGKSGQNERTS